MSLFIWMLLCEACRRARTWSSNSTIFAPTGSFAYFRFPLEIPLQ